MKKHIQIIVIILTLPLVGFCQNKFSVGVNANTQTHFMTVTGSEAPSGIDEKGERGIGYSIGLQVHYAFRLNALLRSGLNYQSNTSRHRIEGLLFGTDINGTESIIQNEITNTSIGIPLDFVYLISSKKEKLKYLLGFGGLININLDTKTNARVIREQMDDFALTQASNEVQEALLSLNFFGGIELQLSDKLILGLEPNIRITPRTFNLYLYNTKGTSIIESGLTIRVRLK